MRAKTDIAYCSARNCEKIRECRRHKSHYRFNAEQTFLYQWVDFTLCEERGYSFFLQDKR